MTTFQTIAAVVGGVAVLGLIAFGIISYNNRSQEAQRTGTQKQSAEQVVDLEVQAQQNYEQSGGTY